MRPEMEPVVDWAGTGHDALRNNARSTNRDFVALVIKFYSLKRADEVARLAARVECMTHCAATAG